MSLPPSITLFLFALTGTIFIMACALALQYQLDLEPCPLCISQRFIIIALGIMALMAVLHGRKFKVYGGIILLLGSAGAALAARQIHLQNMPPEQLPSCMPSLNYLVDVLPMSELVGVFLSGTGDCADIQWVFLGITIPGWSLLIFIVFSLFGVLEMYHSSANAI